MKKLWEFRSTAGTNGSGAHYITATDVDGDGRDEIFDGTICLTPDGKLRWSIYGHLVKDTVLLSSAGKLLLELFPTRFKPVEWDGVATRELISDDGRSVGKFDGRAIVPLEGLTPSELAKGSCVTVADLVGDFRDEVVILGPTDEGGTGVFVYTSTTPLQTRLVTRMAERAYRLWLAHNLTGGYWSHFEPQPQRRSKATTAVH